MADLQQFNKLWQETVYGIEYAVRGAQTKDSKAIAEKVCQELWDLRWGNTTLSPPARQYIDNLLQSQPETGKRLEAALRDFTFKGASPVPGIICIASGILLVFMRAQFDILLADILLGCGAALAAAGAVLLVRAFAGDPVKKVIGQLEELGQKCREILKG